MNWDEIKERLQEQFNALAAKIQENQAAQKLIERYQDLSPELQKAVLFGLGSLVALILFLFPWMFYSGSITQLDEFEEKKQVIRDAFHYGRMAAILPPAPPATSTIELQDSINTLLKGQQPQLLPDQIVSITPFDNFAAKSPALPINLLQSGLAISLSRLNLKQIVDIATQIQELRSTAKMVGLKVKATEENPHYFDVTIKMVLFNLPEDPSAKLPAKPPGFKPPPPPPQGPNSMRNKMGED